jgi:hypothetical protein
VQINPQSSQAEIERFAALAKETYAEKIATQVEPEHNGEIIAIEPNSGAYFLGMNEVDAAGKARAAGCPGPFFFLRVGSKHTHRLMSPRR